MVVEEAKRSVRSRQSTVSFSPDVWWPLSRTSGLARNAHFLPVRRLTFTLASIRIDAQTSATFHHRLLITWLYLLSFNFVIMLIITQIILGTFGSDFQLSVEYLLLSRLTFYHRGHFSPYVLLYVLSKFSYNRYC